MIVPVRCMTCGKVLANKWNSYKRMCEQAESEAVMSELESEVSKSFEPGFKKKILEDLGITKMCCKRHMITHVDIIDML